MKRITLLYFIFSFLAICFSGCKQNPDKNKENLILTSETEKSESITVPEYINKSDTTQALDPTRLDVDFSKREDIEEYSVKELTKLSDTIYKRMQNSTVRHNVAMSSILEKPNRISVVLVNCDEQHINQFKAELSDSRAIVFEEMTISRPKGKSCDSCGIEMQAFPDIYLLPINKIGLRITNNTGAEIMTGKSFYLEQFQNGKWEGVRLMYNFNSLGLSISPEGSHFMETDLQPDTHQYKSGKYRIFKKVSANKKMYILTADFKIE